MGFAVEDFCAEDIKNIDKRFCFVKNLDTANVLVSVRLLREIEIIAADLATTADACIAFAIQAFLNRTARRFKQVLTTEQRLSSEDRSMLRQLGYIPREPWDEREPFENQI